MANLEIDPTVEAPIDEGGWGDEDDIFDEDQEKEKIEVSAEGLKFETPSCIVF